MIHCIILEDNYTVKDEEKGHRRQEIMEKTVLQTDISGLTTL